MDLFDGRYRVLRHLGSGGTGDVFLVRDARDGGETLALKRLRLSPDLDAEAVAELAREFLALASLSHPRLVAARDFAHLGRGGAYFTYDFAPGLPFDRWARGRPFRAIIEAFHQLLGALEFLHNRGILHLDVKPGNAIVAGGAHPALMLIDLGVFRRPGRVTGEICGTLPFMAPEFFRGGPLDRRTDLFAAGLTLRRALEGRDVPDTVERLLERLLAEDPLRRPATAAEAAAALEPIVGPEATRLARSLEIDGVIRSLPFAGRDRAVAALPEALEERRAGRPAPTLLLVAGAPGMGKTRLLREWERRAQVAGAEVFRIDASASIGRAPVLALADRVRRAAEERGIPARDLPSGSASDRGDPEDPLWRSALPKERAARAGGLARTVLALAGMRPVAITIDAAAPDDEALWIAADEIARAAHAAGTPVVCALSVTVGAGARAEERLARRAREPFARRIDLGPLPASAADRIIRSAMPAAKAPPDRVRALRARAAGNPFFLAEILRQALAEDAGLSIGVKEGAIPASIDAALRARLETLDAEDALLAARAALLSGSVPLARWPASWRAALRQRADRADILVHRGVLSRERRGGRTILMPAHPVLREAILARIAPADRTRLSLDAARILETEGGPPEEIAHLYLEGGDAARGVPLALEAAERLWSDRAIEPLPGLYRAILAHIEPSDARRARDARLSLSEALDLLGDFEGARRTLERILSGDEPIDPAERARILRRIAALDAAGGDAGRALERLDEARRALRKAPPVIEEAVRLDLERGKILLERGEADAARSSARRASERLRAERERAAGRTLSGLDRLEAAVAFRLGTIASACSDDEEALAHYARSLELRGADPPSVAVSGLCLNIANLLIARGRYDEAGVHYRRALEIAKKVGARDAALLARANAAILALHRWDLAGARREIDDAERLVAIVGSPRYRAFVRFVAATLRGRTGPASEAIACLEEVASDARARSDPYIAANARFQLALALRLAGRPASAIAETRAGMRDAARMGWPRGRDEGNLVLAGILRQAGDAPGAARALAAIHSDGADAHGHAGAERALERGHTALALGDAAGAEEAFGSAREAFARLGIPARVAEVEAALASVDLALGRPAAARERLAGARREIERAGARMPLAIAVEIGIAEAHAVLRGSVAGFDPRAVRLRLAETRDACARAGWDGAVGRVLGAMARLSIAEGRPARAAGESARALAIAAAAGRGLSGPARRRFRAAVIRPLVGILRAARPVSSSDVSRFLPAALAGPLVRLHAHVASSNAKGFADAAAHILRAAGRIRAAAVLWYERGRAIAAREPHADPSAKGTAALMSLLEEAIDGPRERRIGGRRWIAVPLLAPNAPGGSIAIEAAGGAPEGLALSECAREIGLAIAASAGRRAERREASRRPGEARKKRKERDARDEETRLRAALEDTRRELATTNAVLSGRYRVGGLIGRSEEMQRVFELIEKVAASDISILVSGESGTGKELVAREIHNLSPRHEGPFVCEDCGAIPEGLAETELLGHVRGAFTGAERDRTGRIRAAHGGTLFLDEIGELSLDVQKKLLRVLEEKRVRPVGGSDEVDVDFRLVCATNRDLAAETRAGRFREDLFFRIRGIEVHLPPLRARPEDIPVLAEYFLERERSRSGKPLALDPGALERLMRYEWPGNVRELENEIRRLALVGTRRIGAEAVTVGTAEATGGGQTADSERLFRAVSLRRMRRSEAIARVDRRYLIEALRKAEGNVAEAARRLGLNRRSVYKKLGQYRIDLAALKAAWRRQGRK
ncbi:MAG: sigma 54-interacting transcriptional regulator [Planctomycetes bacterium]|nr:sigma 54-interacting transcriptional regulator [Planctomycetota bacterium]